MSKRLKIWKTWVSFALSFAMIVTSCDWSVFADLPGTEVSGEQNTEAEMPEETETSKETEENTGEEGSNAPESGEQESESSKNSQEESIPEESETQILIESLEPSEEYGSILLEEKEPLDMLREKLPPFITGSGKKQTEDGSGLLEQVEIPVIWECSDDYDAEELEAYMFYPRWDEAVYAFSETALSQLPAIEVMVKKKEVKAGITSQAELQMAMDALKEEIVLESDIAITSELTISSDADITIDGQGFSLYRGQAEGSEYKGVMLSVAGGGADSPGMITLKDIRIDGKAVGGSNGPAVVSDGSLCLDEGTVIIHNENYGFDGESAILDYGGAVWVNGELTVREGASVTGNFADELGGGIYLAPDSSLYLMADVVQGNQVGDGGGYGRDIYASDDSTIYYASGMAMEREEFYICKDALLINPDSMIRTAYDTGTDIEIFLNVSEGSGYSIDEIKKALEEQLGGNVKILTAKNYIDTTDLRKWYVYDHYETFCWPQADYDHNGIPDAWETQYADSLLRPYFPYTEEWAWNVPNPVCTIPDWIQTTEYDNVRGGISHYYLAPFKEHIYTRSVDGKAEMIFAGYGAPPYIDFLFYNPESVGEKVVNFEVDSSQVKTHTLAGNGFLVNTGISGNKLNGYLVYYTYLSNFDNRPTKAKDVSIYKLSDVNVNDLHEGRYSVNRASKVASVVIPGSDWDNLMNIQIIVSPDRIEVRQQPVSSTEDIKNQEPLLSYTITEDTGYSGFGPLVAYAGHGCEMASSFTYSNLEMYFTNPKLEKGTLLTPIREADFTQDTEGNHTRKYFLNLFGEDELIYNETVELGQYQDYLKLMQQEGVSLITDRTTPFKDYLGTSGSQGLYEMAPSEDPPSKLPVDQLVQNIKAYLNSQGTTQWDTSLRPVDPASSVGNIWLALEDGKQIRNNLNGDTFSGKIVIKDNLSYYKDGEIPVYTIRKPGSLEYEPLTVREGSFQIGGNASEWPAGLYTVRQDIGRSAVFGYAYFQLDRAEYRLFYDFNGGKNGPNDYKTYSKGNKAQVQFLPEPVKEGYKLYGWSRNVNATLPEFRMNGGKKEVTFQNQNITLYAIWVEEDRKSVV